MMIACLPLDSRPCNSSFPVSLASFCGHTCIVPDKGDMDNYQKCADFERTKAFLLTAAAQTDALVISIDHLCYGSLLESRADNIDISLAKKRLSLIEEIRNMHPRLPIYAYSIIMRSSISLLYTGEMDAYNAMTEYSVYKCKAEISGRKDDLLRAESAKARIPTHILSRYEKARARNHEINMECLSLLKSGILSSLSLLQEDAQVYGFHKKEQSALLEKIQTQNIKNAYLSNGADEGACLSVMKAITENGGKTPVCVRYLGIKNGDFVALYEDRPFFENVNAMLSYANFAHDENAGRVLCVCCPPDKRQTDWPNPAHAEGIRKMAEEIKYLSKSGKKVYVLDVTRANGGAPDLIDHLSDIMPLSGYSAWNTASNSLGTILAEILSDSVRGRENRTFFWERMLDDFLYQGVVRERINRILASLGEDVYQIRDMRRAEELLSDLMKEAAGNTPAFQHAPAFTARFPWMRTFEAEITIEGEKES